MSHEGGDRVSDRGSWGKDGVDDVQSALKGHRRHWVRITCASDATVGWRQKAIRPWLATRSASLPFASLWERGQRGAGGREQLAIARKTRPWVRRCAVVGVAVVLRSTAVPEGDLNETRNVAERGRDVHAARRRGCGGRGAARGTAVSVWWTT